MGEFRLFLRFLRLVSCQGFLLGTLLHLPGLTHSTGVLCNSETQFKCLNIERNGCQRMAGARHTKELLKITQNLV